MRISYQDFLALKSKFKGPKEIKILTGSMSPFIGIGDNVMVFPLGDRKLKKFDSIVFWREEKLICHFFYKEEIRGSQRIIITKALNSSNEDPAIEFGQVLGVVVRPKLPKWKRLLLRVLK